MKKISANLLATMLCVCAAIAASAQWTQQPTPTTNNLKAVSFYNARIGFAVGEKGTVLRTRNAGQSWQQVTAPGTEDLTSVTLLDSAVVIVTGSNLNGSITYRSANAGASWQKVLSGGRTAYVAKTPGQILFNATDRIYKSNDAGRNWLSLETLSSTSSYNHISFAGNTHGMLGGNVSGFVTYSATFMRTEDAGSTWYGSFPYDFPNANAFSTMDQLNADTVFMFTNFYKGFNPGDSSQLLLLTNFKLRNIPPVPEWHFNTKVIVSSFHDRLTACKFFSGGAAYTVSAQGSIYQSANYGKKWSTEYNSKTALHGLYMINETTGYAVGDGGLILKREVAVAAEQPQLISLKVYPNPASDKTTIHFSLPQTMRISIQVADERGNITYTQPAKAFDKGIQRLTIPVANMQRGLYHVSVLAEGKIISKGSFLVVH